MRRSAPRRLGGGRARRHGSRPARRRAAPRPRRARRRGRRRGERRSSRARPRARPGRAPVAETGDPAAAADLPPADASSTTWMPWRASHARSSKPSRGPRLHDADRRLQDGSARRRAPDGEHEQHALAQPHPLKLSRPRQGRARPGRGTGGRDRHQLGDARLADSPTSTLSRRASIRSDPHPSPTTASATPAATSRADPRARTGLTPQRARRRSPRRAAPRSRPRARSRTTPSRRGAPASCRSNAGLTG